MSTPAGSAGGINRGGRGRLLATGRWVLIATTLVPVALSPGFFFPYVTVRAVYFRVLVEIAAAILGYLVLRRESVEAFRRDFVFVALAGWVAASLLAAVAGVAPMRSIFGDHERMGGVWFWLHLLVFYTGLRTFMREQHWWAFFRAALAVALVIATYGLVRYKYHLFGFGIGGMESGVTIGNSGLLGAYLLCNVALAAMLAARSPGRGRWVYVAVGGLLVAGIVFSGNRSSTLGLVLGAGVALLAFAWFSRSVRLRWIAVASAMFVAAGALPFVAGASWAAPVVDRLPAIGRLSGGVDSVRVVQWRAAVEGIRDRPLLGFGPENYQIVWSRFYHPEMYRFQPDSRFDRAHNAFLDAFATSGVLGLLTLVAVCAVMAWAAVRSGQRNAGVSTRSGGPAVDAIALGFFAAYAFFLFFWFFDLNSTMLWIAVAAFVTSRGTESPLIEFGAQRKKRWQTTLVMTAGALVFALAVYVHGFATLKMARALDQARDPRRSPQELLRVYESVFGSPAPVTHHVFQMYAGHLASFRPRFREIRNDEMNSSLFDRAFVLAVTEFERQARQDPLNENVLVQHARVLILGAYYYGSPRLYESAITKLQHAVELAPRRVTPLLVLGTAYLNVGRPEEALNVYRRAFHVYPPLGQTHSYLAAAHARLQQVDSAAVWLQGAMDREYKPNETLVLQVGRKLAETGRPRASAELLESYLRAEVGTPFLWAAYGGRGNGNHRKLANMAAELFLAAGDSVRAEVVNTAAESICARPKPLVVLSAHPVEFLYSQPAVCGGPWRVVTEF